MAVLRQQNWLGNQRVDCSFLRLVESGVAGDFDALAGTIMAGQKPYITSGFNLITTGITKAQQLQLRVASSSVIHYAATDSGSIFTTASNVPNEVLTSTNTNVSGGFQPASTNYVGIDLVRSVDNTTADLSMFIDSLTLTETPAEVPLARTLNYKIVISTIDFSSSPSVCPIAIVVTDSVNNIVSVMDAKSIFWRLGSGGTAPNPKNVYAWPTGRNETTYVDQFLGADKSISSMKNWADAIMTRLWELGSGEHWYSPTTDKNVVTVTQGSVFSNGTYFEFVSSNLHWKGLVVLFDNSTGFKNAIADQTSNLAGLTDIADGECIYVDIDRTQNRTGASALLAAKAVLTQLGPGPNPGGRYIIAWRLGSNVFTRLSPFPVGTSGQPATTTANGIVSISATPNSSVQPFATLYDTLSQCAVAGGLTRGNSGNGFLGNIGQIQIGGNTLDQQIILQTIPGSSYNVIALGSQPVGKIGTLVSINGTDIANSAENMIIQAQASWASANKTVFQVEGNGAIGLALSPTTVAVPNPSGSDAIGIKLYARTNGLATPHARNQVYIIDSSDGSESLLWEGNSH